ncbi:hypothetical protein BCR43DRAFT_518534 [Syncephalastrum racemosum]|uniref:Uncharacterized protein n=1 Tax=Syncephalastrum racemosum TaxID=13706 RepID=A0A1X2H148_SYNRA|nr:hypothetical protein BCR43DRAFT_518534 [Syncephalastrum racemosum]
MESTHEEEAALIESYHKLNLPSISDKATWISFHRLTSIIVRKEVMNTTNALLATLLPNDSDNDARKARVFLSTYCFAIHDDELLADAPKELKKSIQSLAQFTLEAFEACLCEPSSIQLQHRLHRVLQTYTDVFLAWRKQDRAWLIHWTREYDGELEQLRKAMVARTEGEEAALVNRCVKRNKQRVRCMMRLLDVKSSLSNDDVRNNMQEEEQERRDQAYAWDPAGVVKRSLITLMVSSHSITGFYQPLESARQKAHELAVRSTTYILVRHHTNRDDLVDWITAMYRQQEPEYFADSMANTISASQQRIAIRRSVLRSCRGRGGLYRMACRRIRQLLLCSLNKGYPSNIRLKSYGVSCFEATIRELCMEARQAMDEHYRAFAPTYAKAF